MFSKKMALVLLVLIPIFGIGMNIYAAHKPAAKPKDLSPEEYQIIKKELVGLTQRHDPKFALAQVRERAQTDDALLRSCHVLVHEIGHAAYKKYGSFGEAMKYQDEICNSGYLHGIIESHFSKSEDIIASMRTLCSAYPSEKFLSWECYHGIGHGLMFHSSNDLPLSLNHCDQYESDFARQMCSNGVFMENFNTDQKIHPSRFLKESDPFYPCPEQAPRHKADCYLYAPTYYLSLHKNDYARALQWCQGAVAAYQSTCAKGVGSQAMKENLNNPKLVEKICMASAPSQKVSCIDGMVGLFVNHHGSLEPARALCEELEPSNRGVCYASIQSQKKLFD